MLVFSVMKNSSISIISRAKAEASLNKPAELQQVLAQLEADLLRKETQTVQQKSKNHVFSCVKKFQTLNSYLRMIKTTYK